MKKNKPKPKLRPYRVDYFDFHEVQERMVYLRSVVLRTATANEAKIRMTSDNRLIVRAYRYYGASPEMPGYTSIETLFPTEQVPEILQQVTAFQAQEAEKEIEKTGALPIDPAKIATKEMTFAESLAVSGFKPARQQIELTEGLKPAPAAEPTPDCLSDVETLDFVRGETLDPGRLSHIEQCRWCQSMLMGFHSGDGFWQELRRRQAEAVARTAMTIGADHDLATRTPEPPYNEVEEKEWYKKYDRTVSMMEIVPPPVVTPAPCRCGQGVDTDGDGNCPSCAFLSRSWEEKTIPAYQTPATRGNRLFWWTIVGVGLVLIALGLHNLYIIYGK
jgi:hypothetical protein